MTWCDNCESFPTVTYRDEDGNLCCGNCTAILEGNSGYEEPDYSGNEEEEE